MSSATVNDEMTNSATVNNEYVPLLHATRRNKLTLGCRAAFGVGHVLNDICAALWFSYTLLFMQVVLGMKPILAGALIMIGQVADAMATPVVGILSDRYGTKKLWHLAGTGLVILSFPMIFENCPHCSSLELADNATDTDALVPPRIVNEELSSDWLAISYFVILIVMFQIGWAIVQISHLSLIPDLTPSQNERAELTAIRYTAAVCSSVTVYVITWCVFHATRIVDTLNKVGPGDSYKFREIVWVGVAIGLACSVWFHAGLRPRRYSLRRAVPSASAGVKTRRSVLSHFRSPLLFQVACLYVASRMFVTISLVYIPLYLDEGLDGEGEVLASVPLASFIASFISSLGIKYFNNRYGSKMSNMLGGIISVAGCIWIGYGSGDHVTKDIYGVAVLLGAGSSITSVTSLCITADFIGVETESGAFVYSAVTFADKLFTGFAVVIIEYLKCPSKAMCPLYYRDVLAYVCGGSALCGLLVLATLAPIPLGNKAKDDLSLSNGLQPELLASSDKTSSPVITNGTNVIAQYPDNDS